MYTYLFTNSRLLILSIVLIVVAGTLAAFTVPRMEDPLLTPRAATITTLLPGASAERVEALVTEKIEEELKEIEEIKELNSISRQGVSFIAVELKDTVSKVDAPQIWSRIRDKSDDARVKLPSDATRPDFKRLDIKAYALIVGVSWNSQDKPRFGLLRRQIETLKEKIESVEGTEATDVFGDPQEEILVTIKSDIATSMNLRAGDISAMISASDAKLAAGKIRGSNDDILLEVSGELDSIAKLSHIPIQLNEQGSVIELGDIATIQKAVQEPQSSKVLVNKKPAVAIATFVQPAMRLDLWRSNVESKLKEFEASLPAGIEMNLIFDQNGFVNRRMDSLTYNFFSGLVAIFIVNLFFLGWRSTWIVSLGLPLCVLAVLFVMYAIDIPIHQMSVTGLIISMGLVVDNAIVVVDEIAAKLRNGLSRFDAVASSSRHLAVPLLGATLTTIISFGPIAIMPGPSGEFVGSIATIAIISVAISLFLALTILSALAGLTLKTNDRGLKLLNQGVSSAVVERLYAKFIDFFIRFPMLGVILGLTLPILGFFTFPLMNEQFFPPADRNQFHIELEIPGIGSIAETEQMAQEVQDELSSMPEIKAMTWFIGESAPAFYYNIIPDRKNASRFGQAIVDCSEGTNIGQLIRIVQGRLDDRFPSIACVARQLEQGPPFSAPIEVQIFGPDAQELQRLGEEVRLVLSQTPKVIQTRSDFSESLPKVAFAIDEQQARLVGYSHTDIAAALNALLEGVTGGSILEDSEELPIRVRISNEERGDINRIASLDLLGVAGPGSGSTPSFGGIPLSSLSTLELKQETAAISRMNGQRMNEIQAYIPAGILPSIVQSDFQERLNASGFALPAGYSLQYAGAESERNDAIGNLVVNSVILFVTMVTVLVLILKSFRLTAILFSIAILSVGAGLGSLWVAGLNWGFMSIVGIMGMIGIAVNDSIVMIASLRELSPEELRDRKNVVNRVLLNTRHILATSLTTVAGFTPLFLSGGEFWPPVAVSISGGVLVATGLALIYIPCIYLLAFRLPFRKTLVRESEFPPKAIGFDTSAYDSLI